MVLLRAQLEVCVWETTSTADRTTTPLTGTRTCSCTHTCTCTRTCTRTRSRTPACTLTPTPNLLSLPLGLTCVAAGRNARPPQAVLGTLRASPD